MLKINFKRSPIRPFQGYGFSDVPKSRKEKAALKHLDIKNAAIDCGIFAFGELNDLLAVLALA